MPIEITSSIRKTEYKSIKKAAISRFLFVIRVRYRVVIRHAVAHAYLRQNVARGIVVLFYFAANVGYVHAQYKVIVAGRVRTPYA